MTQRYGLNISQKSALLEKNWVLPTTQKCIVILWNLIPQGLPVVHSTFCFSVFLWVSTQLCNPLQITLGDCVHQSGSFQVISCFGNYDFKKSANSLFSYLFTCLTSKLRRLKIYVLKGEKPLFAKNGDCFNQVVAL